MFRYKGRLAMSNWLNAEVLFSEAELAHGVSNRDVERCFDLIVEKINYYRADFPELLFVDSNRVDAMIASLDHTISHAISYDWIDSEYKDPPFTDQHGALLWLQESDFDELKSWFDREPDWTIRSLWEIRKDMQKQYWRIEAGYEALFDYDELPTPAGLEPSTLPELLKGLIFHLCGIWFDLTGSVKLPEAVSEPDNSLLRYIDMVMVEASVRNRPSKATVLNYVKKFARPELTKTEDARKQQWSERNNFANDHASLVGAIGTPDDIDKF